MSAPVDQPRPVPLKVALVGTGYFGQFQFAAWNRMPEVELVAIVEADPALRDKMRAVLHHDRIFENLDEMLETVRPDLVDLATPPPTHVDLITQCVDRVPTIICQKPFCESIEAAESMVALADQHHTNLIVHENFRFMPWYRAMKSEIEGNALGTVHQATFRFRPGDGKGPDAYLSRQPYFQTMPRFLVHETAIHWIDVFRYLFGEPNSIYADLWRSNPVIAGEDSGMIILGYEDGARVCFDGSRVLDHAADNHRLTLGEMLIEGSAASLRLDGDGNLAKRSFGTKPWHPVSFEFQDVDFGGDCVYHFQNHVVSHLMEGTPLETRARDYLRNLEIEEAAYRSSEEARKILV